MPQLPDMNVMAYQINTTSKEQKSQYKRFVFMVKILAAIVFNSFVKIEFSLNLNTVFKLFSVTLRKQSRT